MTPIYKPGNTVVIYHTKSVHIESIVDFRSKYVDYQNLCYVYRVNSSDELMCTPCAELENEVMRLLAPKKETLW